MAPEPLPAMESESRAPDRRSPAPPPHPPILGPALKVGAATGCAGFIGGGVIASLRSSPTVGFFAAGSGINCFALGSSFWAIRSTILHSYVPDPQPSDLLRVSGTSGALTGFTMGLVLRGRSNAIPGAIFWGLVGLGGQYAYNSAYERRQRDLENGSAPKLNGPGLADRIFNSPWSPVKKLSNEEYGKMLEERLLAVEADIALADEELQNLRSEAGMEAEKKS